MPKSKRSRTTVSLAVKKGKKYVSLPKRSLFSKKKPGKVYAVKKRGGKVIQAREL